MVQRERAGVSSGFPKQSVVLQLRSRLRHLVADFVFSLSEPNELRVGPTFSEIPSQDAANTVVNYSRLQKSNRSKRNWGKAMAAGKYLRSAKVIRK